MELRDTAGEQDDKSLAVVSQWVSSCDGFVLVFSIASRASFDRIRALRDFVLRVKDAENVPIVFVGNKCDMEDQREVSVAETKELALSLGVPCFETSAKTGHNVQHAFIEVVRMLRRRERGEMAPGNPKRSCVAM